MIHINIWDDYLDGEETYAYVEGGCFSHDKQYDILHCLQQRIEAIKLKNSPLACNIVWYDSAYDFPTLVGTDNEQFLYKRWQLQFKSLTHNELEHIVGTLGRIGVYYDGVLMNVYSES